MPCAWMKLYASYESPPMQSPMESMKFKSTCGASCTFKEPSVAMLKRSVRAPVAASAQHEPHTRGSCCVSTREQ